MASCSLCSGPYDEEIVEHMAALGAARTQRMRGGRTVDLPRNLREAYLGSGHRFGRATAPGRGLKVTLPFRPSG